MKRQLSVLLFAFICFSISAKDLLVQLKTNKEIGETINITFEVNDNSDIDIDFGNGSLINFNVSTGIFNHLSNTVAGETIKVYGNAEIITQINCEEQGITNLELYNLSNIKYLDCTINQLTFLNIKNCSLLNHLNCSYNNLESLDLSGCVNLSKLECSNNRLSELDISALANLMELNCWGNKLSALDVSMCNDLTDLNCNSNKLRYSTLKLGQQNLSSYNFDSQEKIDLGESIAVGSQVDLSSEYSFNDNVTTFRWYKQGYTNELIKNLDYTVNEGVFTFLRSQITPVYCQMWNASFIGLRLETNKFDITAATSVNNELTLNSKVIVKQSSISIETLSNSKLEVYNISGKVILKERIVSGKYSFRSPEKGILVVSLKNDNDIFTKKIGCSLQ
ncbi:MULTISPECIES: hypothetical protein [unclassified Carboxylicivirga]|uniref:T9SS type A sorting domain-containing protein n=1 Tax=Carboxylicivirga TaxID=1628153 RepID=UPI003D346E00